MPNSNVTFETGIAAASLGWSRMILLFWDKSGPFENLPFDFDRHRISKYELDATAKKLEGKIEPISKLLTEALRTIISERPKKPAEIVERTPDQIKRARDEDNLKWFLNQFSVQMLDFHTREAPENLHYFAPYMHENMSYVLSRLDFALYDKRADELIRRLTDKLGETLRYDHLYRELNNQNIQAFGRRDERGDFREAEAAAATAILSAASETRDQLNLLVDYIRNEYLAIDLDQTSARAEREYYSAIAPIGDSG